MSSHSVLNGWPPPVAHQSHTGKMNRLGDDDPARTQPPLDHLTTNLMPEASSDADEDNRRAHFSDLFRNTEAKVALLFADDGDYDQDEIKSLKRPATDTRLPPPTTDHTPIQEPPLKKAKRIIDEDDYGDDDEDEDDDDDDQSATTKSKNAQAAAANSLLSPSKSGSSPVRSVSSPGRNGDKSNEDGSQGQAKTSEDARKELEEARNATEEAAKRSFHTLFYTLENDRTAMLEQDQLEESEKQLQAEMDKNGGTSANTGSGQNHGSLSSANLGASSLTLKHLIARIDLKRGQVKASDQELRSLMNEVRKNRSKWTNEENVGQEELYDAAEKVLSELKAHTEYSTPFLQRVNKRDAVDYYHIIKHPMDLGTMTKKLKQLTYKSKAEFVTDLNLIWDNCLRYNQDMQSQLRRMANGMRKEAEKLIPLIPDVVVRPRAEVEAEERRKQNGGEDDGGDDSDDEPIMSSRGRSGAKGATKSRKAVADQKEGTPSTEQKPVLQLNGLLAKSHREGSDFGDGSNGFGTPPIGSFTPGVNGHSGIASNADAMEIDGPSLSGMALNDALGEAAEQEFEDEEYKIWKQVTKKDRASIAKARSLLFADRRLNVDEPALLRSKAAMRRVQKGLKHAESAGVISSSGVDSSVIAAKEASKPAETLAEGMEDEEEKVIPDYYETQNLIPDIPSNLQWVEDGEGQVINQHEEFLRLLPPGHFISPDSTLVTRFDANLRQMQETRKLCSKIGVIKQMQIQTQVYTNQFQKYNPEPFVEADVEPHFIAGEGPVMAPEVCRSAFQRSVAKILYHAGFEELQPSALDSMTDLAGDYFTKILRTFSTYQEAEKKEATGVYAERGAQVMPRFTPEEVLLHTLGENGHSVESLEAYAKDDIDRLGLKLGTIHDRMKSHLADLLRPALNDAGTDGAGAFNDGSEQFVGGDFAEELGEDFFGFKALGLDKEMGLDMMSVPLHLLQSRVRSQFQSTVQTVGTTTEDLFETLPPPDKVTVANIQAQVGLVKNFFLAKLHANGDQPLVEDEDLPVKQRRPRPRLGATGKIVSPQKRPPKEQIALAKKRKKLEASGGQAAEGKNGVNSTPEKGTPNKKIKGSAFPNGAGSTNGPPALSLQPPVMERVESMQSVGNASDGAAGSSMISPESIER